MGGDGTVSASPARWPAPPRRCSCCPAGTLNHFAQDLGVPLDPAEAALLVRDGARRAVDVAEVNGHVFVNNSSIGAYPLAVALRERLAGEGRAASGRRWRAPHCARSAASRR